MAKRRTWIWILATVAGLCVVALIVVAVAGIMFVRRHVDTRQVTRVEADKAFDGARTRFKEQTPLFELESNDQVRVTRRIADLPTSATPPDQLWLLIYEPDEEQLIRLSLPFWILRMGRRNFQVSGREGFDLERLNLDVKELQRIGPTLLLDQRTPSGERVLIWTQ